jgi:hypothetical protein
MGNYDREEAKAKAMKLIPSEDQFGRMTDLRPDDYEAMLNDKPEFPYSQEEVAKMTKEEYRTAFITWECKTADHYVHLRFSYDKFVEWNQKCLDEMYEDDMEHLEWLCEWIAKGNVRNMDMECCGEFHTDGIYFNEDKKLVIYNGR